MWVDNASAAVNAESMYPQIIAVCCALSFASVLVVGSRLWIRFRTIGGLAVDDYMSGLAMLFALIYSALCIAQTKYGLGLPLLLRPVENLVIYTKLNYAGRPFYQIGISFFKIALLLSYLRLLRGTHHELYRRIIIGTGVAIFAGHLACTLALIFACTPVQRSWTPSIKTGYCIPNGPSFTGYAAVTIVSDVAVALLPIPILAKLSIDRRKKIGLIGLFVLGLFTTLCSIFRYLQINRIQYGDGNSTMLILWGTIEFNVGNIISSLPFLAPAFMSKVKQYSSSRRATDYEWSAGGGGSRSKSSAYKLSNFEETSRRSNHRDTKQMGLNSGGSAYTTTATSSQVACSQSEEDIMRNAGGLAGSGVGSDGGDGGGGVGRDEDSKHAIVKSVTYTVQIEDHDDESGSEIGGVDRRRSQARNLRQGRDGDMI